MDIVSTLTRAQRAFLESYFKSIFDGDPEFADADEATYLDELSSTEFSDGDAVHGRIVNIAKALQEKGLLREVISDPANSGHFLTVRFNEQTAKVIYQLVQQTKDNGTFYEMAGLTPQPGSLKL